MVQDEIDLGRRGTVLQAVSRDRVGRKAVAYTGHDKFVEPPFQERLLLAGENEDTLAGNDFPRAVCGA